MSAPAGKSRGVGADVVHLVLSPAMASTAGAESACARPRRGMLSAYWLHCPREFCAIWLVASVAKPHVHVFYLCVGEHFRRVLLLPNATVLPAAERRSEKMPLILVDPDVARLDVAGKT